MDAWILAGQSNMEGVGLLDDPRVDKRERFPVFSFSSAGTWELARDPLHRLWESFTPAPRAIMRQRLIGAERGLKDEQLAEVARISSVSGFGLGVSFGNSMARATGREIALRPTALGGSSLEQWRPTNPLDGGHTLYGGMLERVARARATADINIAGLLWYQGESDATVEASRSYGRRFEAWVDAVRRDLGRPDLPVFVVQLGRLLLTPDELFHAEEPWQVPSAWDAIREYQRTVPSRIDNTGMVSAIDLEMVDLIHIDSRGLDRLGRRLSNLALNGISPNIARVERVADTPNGLIRLRLICEGVSGHWSPQGPISGFEIHNTLGVHPSLTVVDARPCLDQPKNLEIVVRSSSGVAVNEDTAVAYGRGLNPICTLVDAADMPLPAFAPTRITLR